MKSEVLSRYAHGDLSAFGMLLFLAVFIGMLFWVFRRQSGEVYTKLSTMPLEDLKPVSKG